MYNRLYPKKNTTIFRAYSGSVPSTTGLYNTGKNPITQLFQGTHRSQIVLSFLLEGDNAVKITNNLYKANIKLWDAGAIAIPLLQPQEVSLYYNQDDFIEGEGNEFFKAPLQAPANWAFRDSVNTWSAKTLVKTIILDSYNQDIEFTDVELQPGINTFFIEVSYPIESNVLSTKYLFGKETRTIFCPYLEFITTDDIQDNRFYCKTQIPQRLYLVNKNKINFSGVVTANLLDSSRTQIKTCDVINPSPGVYYIEETIAGVYGNKMIYDTWLIDNELFHENSITPTSLNEVLVDDNEFEGMYFYPVSNYPHEAVTHRDKALFKVVAEKRGTGQLRTNAFEYRLVSDNAFEFIPWQKCEVYRNQIFFTINTEFLYPEMNYEIQLRFKTENQVFNSSLTYKFLLRYNGPSHLRELFSSPYNSRNWFSNKILKTN